MRRNPKSLFKIVASIIVIYFLVTTFLNIFKKEDSEPISNAYLDNHALTYETNTDSEVSDVSISGVRDKYTSIKGGGEDEVTVMIYMIGTDLESQSNMATKDVYEMLNGNTSDNINIVLQTGGCKRWNNSLFSNSEVERWAINSQSFLRLKNPGKVSMTNPNTLTDFIKYSADNFPANRYFLILWDHGGGSQAGFGYDENYPKSQSLSPNLIGRAIGESGIKFDMVGFDACLMANLETALALEPYADYMIASEETEPGTGWYYTDWLKMLENNTSTPTITIGKQIIDDYVSRQISSGAEITQSLIDLGELVYTIKEPFKTLSNSINTKLDNEEYNDIAIARSNTKEFSKDSRLDQIDLVDFANRLDVEGSSQLVKAVKSAVKYNRTYNINNSYGLSIYFPYSSLNLVNSMFEIYDEINMETSYQDAVRSFATYASSGQIVTQNSYSTGVSLFDLLIGDNYYTNDSYYDDYYYDFNDVYNQGYEGYGYSDSFGQGYDSWMEPSAFDIVSTFFRNKNNILTPKSLKIKNSNDTRLLSLTEDEWKLVDNITLNMFIDDGNGYLDLGKDNTFDFNEKGQLIIDSDGTWLSINGHVVSYQFVSDTYIDENNYKVVGYIPAYLNNQRVDLIVNFTDDNPDGIILGAKIKYDDTNVEAKGLIEIQDGDEIKFVCNYYGYDGTLIDEYQINDSLIVSGKLELANIYLDNDYVYAYCLHDIYGNNLWTPKTVCVKN